MSHNNPILLIETATERSLVAVANCGKILFNRELPVGTNNSKYLATSVAEALKTLGLTMQEMAAVAVGVGPGSYTGIRVGVALAKALSFGANLPLVGICTLKSFIPEQDGPFFVLIDAKISGVYIIKGCRKGDDVVYEQEAKAMPITQLEPLMKERPLILSPFLKTLKPKVDILYPDANWIEVPPNSLQMARLAEKCLITGNIAPEGAIELMYLRKTQAEIEKQQKL